MWVAETMPMAVSQVSKGLVDVLKRLNVPMGLLKGIALAQV